MSKHFLKLMCAAAGIALISPPSYANILGSCKSDESSCEEMQQAGKLSFTSPTTLRSSNDLPPNTETRRPADELVVLRPDINAYLEADTWMVAPFESGNHTMSEAEKAALDKIIAKRPAQKIQRISVTGFADVQKPTKELQQTFKTNQELSEARAVDAAQYIKSLQGMENIEIATQGRGNQLAVTNCRAISASASEADIRAYKKCLSNDRRVEVQIWYIPNRPLADTCKLKQEAATQNLPFRISVDGQPLDALDVANSADTTRCTDVALERADIQVKFDGFEVDPVLNITAYPNAAMRGGEVTFTPYTNYTSFVDKAEIRVFAAGQSTQKKPLHVLALNEHVDTSVSWKVPEGIEQNAVQYVLRVYDAEGTFDETTPKELRLTSEPNLLADEQSVLKETHIGYDKNHLQTQHIPISGGAVTVSGKGIASGTKVSVMGREVPVDEKGSFAYRQIVSGGHHHVSVVTNAADGTKAEFNRALYIPTNDWFYVALGDLTIGKNNVGGPVELVTGENTKRNQGKVYADGRAAFYLKGKVKGEWLLTASADTQEQPLEDLFTGFTDKNPRYLLRRIDPNAYYPVYGDDSTTVEDAPTQGKFYVRLEKGDSKVLWGNFKTSINGTDLVNYSRGLYGANVQYKSEETTKFGERRTEVDGFAADPGTLNSLEEFRGTGGSLYYLRGQDLVVASERLRVETRDRDSNIVLNTRYLVYGQDYEINYIQGRVILREPLSSTSTQSTVVRTGSLAGNPEFLVVDYEYTPGAASISNLVKGGHASHWLNDYIKLGVTGYQQNNPGAKQDLKGVDTTLRYAPGTYLKLEAAQSKGPGDGAFNSQNGGFDFNAIPQTSRANIEANAFRAETGIDFKEFSDSYDGTIGAYILKREDGFSSPGQLTNEEVTQSGITADLPVTQSLSLGLKADHKDAKNTGNITAGEVSAHYKASPANTVTFAVRTDERELALSGGVSPSLSEQGMRTDSAMQFTHAPLDDNGNKESYEVYALGQATLQRDGSRRKNNRIGAGGRVDVSERVSINGEITGGNGGLGALAGAEYHQSDRTTYYANYVMDNERTDLGLGSGAGRTSNFTTGVKSRYSDSLSVFSEHRHQSYENGPSGLIHAYGLDLAAYDVWNFGLRFENGTLSDNVGGDTDRQAFSFNTGYQKDKTKYAGTVEWRNDDNTLNGKRTSWLMRNNIAYQTSEDWRFQGGLDFAISDAGSVGAIDSDFTELTLGYAYRPILNDRLNALIRYTYLDEQSTSGQLTATRFQSASDFEQRSHVFAIDGIYDLTPRFALGGKVGYRFGELRDVTATNSQWFSSQAWLGVIRGDYHVVRHWDVIGELRYLDAKEAGDAKAGALVGVYRHVNDNVKVGVGYNFTDFSDDLTNLDYSSKGPFINLIGKF